MAALDGLWLVTLAARTVVAALAHHLPLLDAFPAGHRALHQADRQTVSDSVGTAPTALGCADGYSSGGYCFLAWWLLLSPLSHFFLYPYPQEYSKPGLEQPALAEGVPARGRRWDWMGSKVPSH